MDINKDVFDGIFGFDGGVNTTGSLMTGDYSFDSSDRLFGALQLYDHGGYLSKRTRDELRDRVMVRMYSFIGMILEDVDLRQLHRGEEINLYEDEFYRVGCMFQDLIKYYEGLEEYERCAYFLRVRDEYFFKIKILE